MDDRTRRVDGRAPEQPDAADGAALEHAKSGDSGVTGVAKGSLGTGTALDETQEWDVSELQAAAAPASGSAPATASAPAATPAPAPAPQPAAMPAPAVAEPPPERRPEAARTPLAAAPRLQPVERARPIRSGPSPRTVGIAAAVVLALVAGAAVLGSLGHFDTGTVGPLATDPATTQPTLAAPADGTGGGDGKDEKNGKGKGNGNGNGGGRGTD